MYVFCKGNVQAAGVFRDMGQGSGGQAAPWCLLVRRCGQSWAISWDTSTRSAHSQWCPWPLYSSHWHPSSNPSDGKDEVHLCAHCCCCLQILMCLCRGWWLSRGGWWWLSCVHLVQILFRLWYTLYLYLDWFWQLVGYRGLLYGHSYLGLHGVYGEGSSSSLVSVNDVYHG